MQLLEVRNLKKVYASRFSKTLTKALNGINLEVKAGEFVAIMGESGSGKTTLLNILSGIDKLTSGEIYLKGENIALLKEKDMAKFRREKIGFVFQHFNLLNSFTNKDNILLPLVLNKVKPSQMDMILRPVARKLGIEDLLNKYPFELSGGQKQRIAIARSLITNPDLILADEPTGALDSKNSDELLELFEKINEGGQTILMVTHSTKAASYASRVVFIKDGVLFHEIYKGDKSNEEMFVNIADTLTLLTREA